MTTKQIHAAKSTIRGGDWQRKGLPKRSDPHGTMLEATWYSEQLLDGELEPLRKWLGRGAGKVNGAIVAEWRGDRLYRLYLSKRSGLLREDQNGSSNGDRAVDLQDSGIEDSEFTKPKPSQTIQRECQALLERGLVGLLQGESEPLPWERMITEDRTEFQQRVLQLCYQIPFGETLSYKALAERAGRPLAARAVGQTMATNRIPLLIPCHRVIAANRTLCGFSAPGGIDTKRQLLALESELAAERKSSW